jgi:hypothetical protein
VVVGAGGAAGRLGDAESAATLKNDALTVSHFRAGLYGGTISLAGAVDGTALRLKGGAWRELCRRSALPGNTTYPARQTSSTGAITPLSILATALAIFCGALSLIRMCVPRGGGPPAAAARAAASVKNLIA